MLASSAAASVATSAGNAARGWAAKLAEKIVESALHAELLIINHMNLQLRKAERKKAKLRVGLAGPSGSGKTYSALLLASGIASWDKIAMIDTENGSGELYTQLGGYNVITLGGPFEPEKYMEAIKLCEKSGIEVIIIDSITHEWDGAGGGLEIIDKLGGRYQDWSKVTPRHKGFIDAILQSSCHVITTVRKKQDYEMTKDQNGKLKVEKVGMKEITREGFEYELTLSFELDIRHNAKAGKDRTGLFMDKPEFVVSHATGQRLVEWANLGIDDPETGRITRAQLDKLQGLIKQMKADPAEVDRFIMGKKKVGMHELTAAQADEFIKIFSEKVASGNPADKSAGDGKQGFAEEVQGLMEADELDQALEGGPGAMSETPARKQMKAGMRNGGSDEF